MSAEPSASSSAMACESYSRAYRSCPKCCLTPDHVWALTSGGTARRATRAKNKSRRCSASAVYFTACRRGSRDSGQHRHHSSSFTSLSTTLLSQRNDNSVRQQLQARPIAAFLIGLTGQNGLHDHSRRLRRLLGIARLGRSQTDSHHFLAAAGSTSTSIHPRTRDAANSRPRCRRWFP